MTDRYLSAYVVKSKPRTRQSLPGGVEGLDGSSVHGEVAVVEVVEGSDEDTTGDAGLRDHEEVRLRLFQVAHEDDSLAMLLDHARLEECACVEDTEVMVSVLEDDHAGSRVPTTTEGHGHDQVRMGSELEDLEALSLLEVLNATLRTPPHERHRHRGGDQEAKQGIFQRELLAPQGCLLAKQDNKKRAPCQYRELFFVIQLIRFSLALAEKYCTE